MIQIESFAKKKRNANTNTSGGNTTIINNGGGGGGTLNLDTHYFWGQPYNGTQDVSGDLSYVGNITSTGDITTTGDIGGQYITANEDLTVNGDGHFSNDVGISGDLSADDIISDTINSNTGDIKNLTVENLEVTKAAHFFKLIIDEVKSVGGRLIITPANAEIFHVTETSSYYQCYFRATDADGNEINNQFVNQDQILCQTFNAASGTSYNVSNKYYWCLCVGTGVGVDITVDGQNYNCHYIRLSKTDKDSNSNGVPEKGDKIVMLGNRTTADRQSAIIVSAYNDSYLDQNIAAPSIVQYTGINDYNLANHRLNVISKNLNSFKGDFISNAGTNIGNNLISLGQALSNLGNTVNTQGQNITNLTTTVNNQTQNITNITNALNQLGGLNMIHNSAFVNDVNGVPYKWAKWGTPNTLEIVTIANRKWMHCITSNKWTGLQQTQYARWGSTSIDEGFKPNTTYTISFDAFREASLETTTFCGVIIHFRNSSNQNVGQALYEIQPSLTPQRYTYTFTTPNNSDICSFSVMLGTLRNSVDDDVNIFISHPKLEIGELATDWTPSPYDFEDDIEALKKELYNNSLFQDYIQSGTFFSLPVNEPNQTCTYTPSTNTYRLQCTDNTKEDLFYYNNHLNYHLDAGVKYAISFIPYFNTQYQTAQIYLGIRDANGNKIGTDQQLLDTTKPCTSYNNQTITAYIDLRNDTSNDRYLWLYVESIPVSNTPATWYINIKDITIWKYTAVESQIAQTASEISLRVTQTENDLNDVSTSVSELSVRAGEIEASVDEVSLKIDNKQIELNGDTVVNGSVNIKDNYTGINLVGNNSMTQLTPVPIGTYGEFNGNNYNYNRPSFSESKELTASDRTLTMNKSYVYGYVRSGDNISLGAHYLVVQLNNTVVTPASASTVYKIMNADTNTQLGTYTISGTNTQSYFYTYQMTTNCNIRIDIASTVRYANNTNNNAKIQLFYTVRAESNQKSIIGPDGIGLKGNGYLFYTGQDGFRVDNNGYQFKISNGEARQSWSNSWYELDECSPNVLEYSTNNYIYNCTVDDRMIILKPTVDNISALVRLPNIPYIGKKIQIILSIGINQTGTIDYHNYYFITAASGNYITYARQDFYDTNTYTTSISSQYDAGAFPCTLIAVASDRWFIVNRGKR